MKNNLKSYLFQKEMLKRNVVNKMQKEVKMKRPRQFNVRGI